VADSTTVDRDRSAKPTVGADVVVSFVEFG
jgi:hypothetical protein